MSRTAYQYQAPGSSLQPIKNANSAGDREKVNHPIWTAAVFDEQSRNIDSASDDLIVGWSLLQMYGAQMVKADNRQSVIPRKTLPERLASTLLYLAEDHDGVIENISFDRLAIALETHRETVASLLRAFRRQGLVDFGRRRILILDFESLHEIGGEPDLLASI